MGMCCCPPPPSYCAVRAVLYCLGCHTQGAVMSAVLSVSSRRSPVFHVHDCSHLRPFFGARAFLGVSLYHWWPVDVGHCAHFLSLVAASAANVVAAPSFSTICVPSNEQQTLAQKSKPTFSCAKEPAQTDSRSEGDLFALQVAHPRC